jgi:hypothetical protein
MFVRLGAVVVSVLFVADSAGQGLGSLTFPNSGAPVAQPAFIEGVKALHNYQFEEARESFRRAQKMDPDFALAYWGEALSYNNRLTGPNADAGRAALEKLAPTHHARREKARYSKEKALLDALAALFAPSGDQRSRDRAYAEAMGRMYATWPDDHEIAAFYAASLLWSIPPEDQSFRLQVLAASIAQKVFSDNPKHPGAAHYIIHALDDPVHAPLAVPAADTYASIAPGSDHALHMPSHIYVQLGMWERLVSSNRDAYNAGVDRIGRLKLAVDPSLFHPLSWLAYGNLMLGRFAEAAINLTTAQQLSDNNPDNLPVRLSFLGMRARHIIETGVWDGIERVNTSAPANKAHSGASTAVAGLTSRVAWTFVVGVSAAKRKDWTTVEEMATLFRSMHSDLAKAGRPDLAKRVEIVERELSAMSFKERSQMDEALRVAREAADIELSTVPVGHGPP